MINRTDGPSSFFENYLSRIAQYFLPSQFGQKHLKIIMQFLRVFIITGNRPLIIEIAILSVISRFLKIASFAVALKAVIAAIRPDLVLRVIGYATEWLNLDKKFEYDDLPFILICLILLVSGANWLAGIRVIQRSHVLNDRIVNNPNIGWNNRTLEQDIFLIERTPGFAKNIIKCIDIILFLCLMICLVFVFSPELAFFLIPLIVVLIVMHIISGRNKLQVAMQMREAKLNYTTMINEKGKSVKRRIAEDAPVRNQYFKYKYNIAMSDGMKSQFDSFVAAIALGCVIYYLFQIKIDVGALASLLIIFVLAIRQTLSAGRELGSQLLAILALRRETRLLESLLSRYALA